VLGGLDTRWLDACRAVIDEQVDASTTTKKLVLARVAARLERDHGAGQVPIPGTSRAYEALAELGRGRNTFTGSAKARRSIANRPTTAYGRLRASRPGEFVLLDTTPLDVFAMDPVTLRWVRAELTVGMDLYTRTILGLALTPVSTKSVDVAGVLYQAIQPPSRPEHWPPDAAWPWHGLPATVVLDAERTDGPLTTGRHPAATDTVGPAVLPETLVVDRGRVYVSAHLTSACAGRCTCTPTTCARSTSATPSTAPGTPWNGNTRPPSTGRSAPMPSTTPVASPPSTTATSIPPPRWSDCSIPGTSDSPTPPPSGGWRTTGPPPRPPHGDRAGCGHRGQRAVPHRQRPPQPGPRPGRRPGAPVESRRHDRRERACPLGRGPGAGLAGRVLRRRTGRRVSTTSAPQTVEPGPPDAGASARRASVARKEGWIALAEAEPRQPPERLDPDALAALGEGEREVYDDARADWHANLGPLRTPALGQIHDDLWEVVDANRQDDDRVRGAAAIDAHPGLGKTTTALSFAKAFHRRERRLRGHDTPDGHEHLPVCRVGLTSNTTMKGFNQALLDFYGHRQCRAKSPTAPRSTRSRATTWTALLPVAAVMAAATSLPVSMRRTTSVTSAPPRARARAAPVTTARRPVRSSPPTTSSAVLVASKVVVIRGAGMGNTLQSS